MQILFNKRQELSVGVKIKESAGELNPRGKIHGYQERIRIKNTN